MTGTTAVSPWILQDVEQPCLGDEIGGDGASPSWSARWLHVGGHAALTRHWYVVDSRERPGEPNPELPYVVENATEWVTFADASDIGGTETWSRVEYGCTELAYRSWGVADVVANDHADHDRRTFADGYDWDGQPFE